MSLPLLRRSSPVLPLPSPRDDLPRRAPLDSALLRLPALMVIALSLVLAGVSGGFRQTTWYPAALFVLVLLVVTLAVASPRGADLGRPFWLAVAGLAGLTVWSFASIAWAHTPADAWDGANRALLFLCAVAIVGLRRWPAGLGLWVLGVVAGGVFVLGALVLADLGGPDAPSQFIQGRLAEPLGYANGNAALWLVAFWPALHLSTVRTVPLPVRALMLGGATMLLGLALLTQSRGGAAGFVVTAIAFIALHPRRWPALGALVVTVALLAGAWTALVDVRLAETPDELVRLTATARESLATIVVIAALVGALAAAAGRMLLRHGVPRQVRRTADGVLAVVACALAVAGAGLVVANAGWIDTRWQEFRSGSYEGVEDRRTRFTGSLGSGRYDFYRVSLEAFERRPVTGVGADSFSVEFLQHRRVLEAPRYPHSLFIGVLGQLGAVGALLLALFLGGLGWGIGRVRRRGTQAAAGIAVAGAAGGLGWLTHGAVDWLWEFPALSILALSLLVLAARTDPVEPGATGERWTTATPSSVRLRIVLALAAVASVFALALPAAAARMERSAYDVQARDGGAALTRLGHAAELNPLNADPLLARSVLARRLGDSRVARSALVEALRREPDNWLLHFELGLLEASQRHWTDADLALVEAQRLNPRQPDIDDVREQVAEREEIDPDAIEADLTAALRRNQRSTSAAPDG